MLLYLFLIHNGGQENVLVLGEKEDQEVGLGLFLPDGQIQANHKKLLVLVIVE